jgi:hypothetical protein
VVVFGAGGFFPLIGGGVWCIRNEIQIQFLKNALLPTPKEGNKVFSVIMRGPEERGMN